MRPGLVLHNCKEDLGDLGLPPTQVKEQRHVSDEIKLRSYNKLHNPTSGTRSPRNSVDQGTISIEGSEDCCPRRQADKLGRENAHAM